MTKQKTITIEKIVESKIKAELEKINEGFAYPLLGITKDQTDAQKIDTLFLPMKLNHLSTRKKNPLGKRNEQ